MIDLLEKPTTVSKPAAVVKENKKVKKVLIIVSKGKLEDVYAGLVMANGALMEGMEAKMFFTFFGLEAITKKNADHLHTATVGNPAFMPGMPTW
jgi:Uncharacterized conserved protein